MGRRRKGERPVEKVWPAWDGDWHPVRRMIDDGDDWFRAWVFQAVTPWVRLARASGVPLARIVAIDNGDAPTADEIAGFAKAWDVDPAQIIASMDYAARRRG